jgi:hypothetical protein
MQPKRRRERVRLDDAQPRAKKARARVMLDDLPDNGPSAAPPAKDYELTNNLVDGGHGRDMSAIELRVWLILFDSARIVIRPSEERHQRRARACPGRRRGR